MATITSAPIYKYTLNRPSNKICPTLFLIKSVNVCYFTVIFGSIQCVTLASHYRKLSTDCNPSV